MVDPFYLIVDSAAWLERLLPQGVKLVQLRMKDVDAPTIASEITKAKSLCAKFSAQLVINDYWKEAIDAGCDYLHLGQEDLSVADIPAIRRAGLKLGLSTHSHEELDRALSFDPDYVALGPVYPTILKQMPFAPQGLERLGEWKKLIGQRPLVGIGGVNLERCQGVLDAGADSAAVVTDVLLNQNPEQRARDFVTLTRPYLKRV